MSDERTGGGSHDVVAQLRFLSAVQHEANTPLAVIRGWADTFTMMWQDLSDADRERGITSIQRHVSGLGELLDALFVELRADAHARGGTGGTTALRDVLPGAVDPFPDVSVAGEVPDAPVGAEVGALEVLIAAAATGIGLRGGTPVEITVDTSAERPVLDITGAGTPPTTHVGDDPFDPFPGGDPSPSGIRLYAARRLAGALGATIEVDADDRLRLTLPAASA